VLHLRRTLAALLSLAGVAGLLACPQLLPDDFRSAPSGTEPACVRLGTCESGSGGAALGAAGAEPGTGGSASGTGGSAPGTGGSSADAGSGGQATTSAGSGGASGSGTAADGGPEPTPDRGCRTIFLNDDTHSANGNCVGINGWNQIVIDPTTTSEVALSYRNGNPCFDGTIEPAGWGAVYNLTFANDEDWDSTDFDVEGIRLDFTGPSRPPTIKVTYTAADSDFCQLITPLETASLLFANSHPNCLGSPGSSTPDREALQLLRLNFPKSATAYDLDFCMSLTAIP
jgi:hypothetical protein